MSIHALRGESALPSDRKLPADCLRKGFSGGAALTFEAGGVPGRLETVEAAFDNLPFALDLLGVLLNPSSFLRASAVSESTSLPSQPMALEGKLLSDLCMPDFIVPLVDEGKYPVILAVACDGGVLTEAKLLTDPEPRRN